VINYFTILTTTYGWQIKETTRTSDAKMVKDLQLISRAWLKDAMNETLLILRTCYSANSEQHNWDTTETQLRHWPVPHVTASPDVQYDRHRAWLTYHHCSDTPAWHLCKTVLPPCHIGATQSPCNTVISVFYFTQYCFSFFLLTFSRSFVLDNKLASRQPVDVY